MMAFKSDSVEIMLISASFTAISLVFSHVHWTSVNAAHPSQLSDMQASVKTLSYTILVNS